jgi:hypothetical protein
MLAHLFADCCAYATLPECFDPWLVAHHVLTALLGVLAVVPAPFAHHYDLFFIGVAEASSVPLGVMELCKLLPAFRTAHPRLHRAARRCFAFAFVALRLLYWPVVSLRFWRDAVGVLWRGEAHSPGVALLYLGANGVLTAMQAVWGRRLLRGVLRPSPRSGVPVQ